MTNPSGEIQTDRRASDEISRQAHPVHPPSADDEREALMRRRFAEMSGDLWPDQRFLLRRLDAARLALSGAQADLAQHHADLFVDGEFVAHSGATLSHKIECDALSDASIACLAKDYARTHRFGAVHGVPRGGLRLAAALEPYITEGPIVIADDVLTTGGSMVQARIGKPETTTGLVIFARGPSPSWVTPLWRSPEAHQADLALRDAEIERLQRLLDEGGIRASAATLGLWESACQERDTALAEITKLRPLLGTMTAHAQTFQRERDEARGELNANRGSHPHPTGQGDRVMDAEEACAIVDGWAKPERYEVNGQPFIEVEAPSRQIARTLRQALAEAQKERDTFALWNKRHTEQRDALLTERDVLRRKLDAAMRLSRRHGLVRRERMVRGGWFEMVGYSCRECHSDWDTGQPEEHAPDCALAALESDPT